MSLNKILKKYNYLNESDSKKYFLNQLTSIIETLNDFQKELFDSEFYLDNEDGYQESGATKIIRTAFDLAETDLVKLKKSIQKYL